MQHYCGIDLHSNNHVVVVIDQEDKRVFEKRLNNDLSLTLKALSPYRESLQGIAVESTFNWCWLVDDLQAHGHPLRLVNTAAVTQYDGLKYSGDHHDALPPCTSDAAGHFANRAHLSQNTKSDQRPIATTTFPSQGSQHSTD